MSTKQDTRPVEFTTWLLARIDEEEVLARVALTRAQSGQGLWVISGVGNMQARVSYDAEQTLRAVHARRRVVEVLLNDESCTTCDIVLHELAWIYCDHESYGRWAQCHDHDERENVGSHGAEVAIGERGRD